MMEAPDSPPDTHHAAANQSISLSGPQTASGSRANGETKTNHGAPGSSWNNKKWHEEYERASSQLLDQDWNHGESDFCAFFFTELGLIRLCSDVW
jgi:hypothetical protein